MFPQVIFLQGVQEIAPLIDNQKVLMVVYFPETFSRLLNSDQQTTLQLIFDGRRSNSAQIVSGYVTTIVEQFNTDFTTQSGYTQQNVKLFPRNWYNPNLLYYWYNIPSLVATLSMLTCLVVTTQSVARERELGTFDQLLVSPLLPVEILIGKIVPGVIIGMIEGMSDDDGGGMDFRGSLYRLIPRFLICFAGFCDGDQWVWVIYFLSFFHTAAGHAWDLYLYVAFGAIIRFCDPY